MCLVTPAQYTPVRGCGRRHLSREKSREQGTYRLASRVPMLRTRILPKQIKLIRDANGGGR